MAECGLVLRGLAAIVWGGVLFFFCVFPSLPIRAEEIKYDRGGRRDPFIPLIGPHAKKNIHSGSESLSIEGIIFDPDRGSYVLIGGHVYKEGEDIGGAKVVQIFPDRVILLQESKEVVIWMREEVLEGGQKDGNARPQDLKKPLLFEADPADIDKTQYFAMLKEAEDE